MFTKDLILIPAKNDETTKNKHKRKQQNLEK